MTKTELVRFYYTLWFAIASEAKFIELQFINTNLYEYDGGKLCKL